MKINRTTRKSVGQKRFLINAIVLAAACVLLVFRIPVWGVAQVLIVALLGILAAFQLILYIKLSILDFLFFY